jgi:putative heme iron utilization protein
VPANSGLWHTFKMSEIVDKVRAARELLLKNSFGVLSTISVDVPGYPFGSVTPYCFDENGQPIVYISHIAQHTRNIMADPRLSLTVVEEDMNSDDVQSRGRVTCIANGRQVDESVENAGVSARYFRYFPSSRQYDRTHDFTFFRLELVRIRFIGGFGQIFWLDPGEFTAKNPFSPVQELQIVQHMNNDHAGALKRYCGGVAATMVGIDSDGFDVLKSGKKVRFTFQTPIHTMNDARRALSAMAE